MHRIKTFSVEEDILFSKSKNAEVLENKAKRLLLKLNLGNGFLILISP